MRKSISGRDVLARFEELKEEYEVLSEIPDEDDFETLEEFQEACDEQAEELACWIDVDEYEDLKRVIDDITENLWLVHEDEFEDYVYDLADDEGFPRWLAIDWEATADEVKMDYTAIEIGSNTYYFRE